MRRRIVAANWKMHGARAPNRQLLEAVKPSLQSLAGRMDIVLCPAFPHLDAVAAALAGSGIRLGAQNFHSLADGAMTGEVSCAMLVDAGVEFVIVGHSERRGNLGETDAQVAEKFAAAGASGLTPILCVGETLAQREAGETASVVSRQLFAVAERVGAAAFARAVIAYEPVWAIGTGKTATPAQAQAVHTQLRAELARRDGDIAENIRILYGGSVNAANAAELFAQADIDGGLVGGASLKAEEFITICAGPG